MTTDTLAALAAELAQLASEGPALIHLQSGAYISRKLGEAAKALAAQATTGAPSEPFGYFKAQPFGWTDCAETDDGAVALYEWPQQAALAAAITNDQLLGIYRKHELATADLVFSDLRKIADDVLAAAALPQPPQPQSAQPEVTK